VAKEEEEMDPKASFDQAKADAFNQKANGDLAGGWVAVLCHLGDELGLFRILAEKGPLTSAELAARAEVNERYTLEWLSALACAGYLTYDPSDERFALPPEHAPTLTNQGTWSYVGGAYHLFTSLLRVLDLVASAFRHGGGVPPSAYPLDVWRAIDRCTSPTWELDLIPQWLPAMPEVKAALENGASLADIGCGHGQAIIALARSFPRARFVGYDAFGPSVVKATGRAEAAGVADRVRFVEWDVARGLPEQFDLITTFDVVHDSADPSGLLRAIHQALRPGGTFVLMDQLVLPTLAEHVAAPAATGFAFSYAISLFYCMSISLGQNGAGLGTCGLPEPRVRQLCLEAGFSGVRRLPFENAAVYEVKP
jgi:ubiquinone/menaquinone biosynthesis C-methylase UbiE